MAQIDDLLNQAAEIRDAEQDKENTALRVGQMLIAIIQHIAGFVSAEDLKAVLADYAPLQGALVHWRNSRVVCLASMGTDLDNIDGGDWQYTNHTGDIVFNPSRRSLSIVGKQDNYSLIPGVFYVNLHSRHCYVWDTTTLSMIEITDSSRPTIIDYRNTPSFAQVAIGESYYFESDKVKKIAIKTSSSGSYSYDPDPKKIYVFKDTCESMIWNATTSSWVTVGSNGGGISEEDIINDLITGGRKKALSAEMGKWLAMMSGSYAQAWSRSKVVTSPFCWIWDETLSDGPVKKPIWHIGNSVFIDAAGSVVSVSAGDRPGTPSFSINGTTPTDDMEVARNTQLTITPVAGAVLKYSIDDAEYITSDGAVTVTLTGSGTKTIKAYCSNSAGDSDLATLRLVVSGIPEPSFAAGPDTTITTIGNDRIVTRGGVIIITGDEELHYRVGGGTWRTVSSSHGEAPTARVTIDGDKTVEAYNTVDGENSGTVSWSFKMAALAAPVISPASGELPSAGGTVELSAATGADIYYNLTTDGTDPADPTDASTQYTVGTPISVSVATKIKAIAKDDYGTSAVSSASYTIKEAGITIVTTAPTTLTMPNATGSPFSLVEGKNVIPFSQIGSSVNMQGNDLLIGDAAAIKSIDWDGFSITNASWKGALFYALFKNKDTIEEFLNLTITTDSVTSLQETFYQCDTIKKVKISGTAENIAWILTAATALEEADFSGLTITNSSSSKALSQCFYNTVKAVKIDIRGLDCATNSDFNLMFSNCGSQGDGCLLTIGGGFVVSAGANITNMFSGSKIKTLRCVSSTPPAIDSSADWLAALVAANPNVTIEIPSGAMSAYQTANGWSSHSAKLTEYNN